MENENETIVDMVLLEQVHGEMLTDAKVMLIMLLTSLQNADEKKNEKAMQEAVDYCADTLAHKIAFQYAIRKAAQSLEQNIGAVIDGKKNVLGFSIMSQACEVHQKLRETLKDFFRDNLLKLRAKQAGNLNRFN